MQADDGQKPSPDRDLWLVCRDADAPEDEAARLLELAAFAEDTLDEDDRERIAAWLALDGDASADVDAARALGGATIAEAPAETIARANAAHPSVADAAGRVIPFPPSRREAANWNGVARWGSLAAAVVIAGWLGFNLGIDTWSGFSQVSQPGDETLHELLDPSAGFMRDLTDAAQT